MQFRPSNQLTFARRLKNRGRYRADRCYSTTAVEPYSHRCLRPRDNARSGLCRPTDRRRYAWRHAAETAARNGQNGAVAYAVPTRRGVCLMDCAASASGSQAATVTLIGLSRRIRLIAPGNGTDTCDHVRTDHPAQPRRERRDALVPASISGNDVPIFLCRRETYAKPTQREHRPPFGGALCFYSLEKSGAGEGIRTLDPNLGKVVLYP